ncbi:hypothetical protein [Methylobacterium sp. 37f]|uniref:hypothetical protein n=1 Tax=Methylobacterium sp. 37f TaxID=2817058 RepID=UPI001FFCCA9B|nr:hypothetical protein [Methylobacterium sp. 37f]MCK2056133.1 hypothetical protein [Methylobacterium sp. 37f]
MTMSVHDALEAWAEGRLPVERALALTGADSVADMIVLCGLCDVQRPLLAGPPKAAYDPADARFLEGMPMPRARPAGHIAEDVGRPRDLSPEERAARHAEVVAMVHSAPDAPAEPGDELYPVEDGPGSGRRVELTVRVLIGTARSTVIVADPTSGRALAHEVVAHGAEPQVAADAVASLVASGIAGNRQDG